ncbi:MAG: 1-(5-phosphoribosyl)-5-((5-phosphoribosylamino)methylideneamino)imidazole-4-carboxamide isomerase, partial [Hyphomonadaceae bacterium]|nr:1-(5-phosphoribosyl)-5-((5-phosphoribosylamino)methylideneamino)imidazole-4-carboxamide isomerase [Hyphomonadaceae bacterium]
FERLRQFAKAGAEWVHIVDLDGARTGRPAQYGLIAQLAKASGLKIQCGGGVRTAENVATLLESGVSRVVVGSVAVRSPEEVRDWLNRFGAEHICIALDVRASDGDWHVAVDGWAADGGATLEGVLNAYPSGEIRHALVTDISRDGALSGANLDLIRTLQQLRPELALQASGGVASLEDLAALKRTGASAAIVGRALYEERFTLEDALAL